MVGGAGFEREVSYGTAIDCALVEAYQVSVCRQPRLPTCSCKWQLARQRLGVCLRKAKASGRVDVYTRG